MAAFDGAVHELGKEQYKKRQQRDAEGEKFDGHGLGKFPENEGRKRHAGVRKCHQKADDGTRVLRPEIVGNGVDEAGEDGPAADADDEKADERGKKGSKGEGKRDQSCACEHDEKPDAHHAFVARLFREKAAQEPPCRDADEKREARKAAVSLFNEYTSVKKVLAQTMGSCSMAK